MSLILQKPFERIINLFKKHRINSANLSILLSAITSCSITKPDQRMALKFGNALYKIPKIIIAPCFLSLEEKEEVFHNSCSLMPTVRTKIKQFREQARDTIKGVRRFRYIEALRKELELDAVLASLSL